LPVCFLFLFGSLFADDWCCLCVDCPSGTDAISSFFFLFTSLSPLPVLFVSTACCCLSSWSSAIAAIVSLTRLFSCRIMVLVVPLGDDAGPSANVGLPSWLSVAV